MINISNIQCLQPLQKTRFFKFKSCNPVTECELSALTPTITLSYPSHELGHRAFLRFLQGYLGSAEKVIKYCHSVDNQ